MDLGEIISRYAPAMISFFTPVPFHVWILVAYWVRLTVYGTYDCTCCEDHVGCCEMTIFVIVTYGSPGDEHRLFLSSALLDAVLCFVT